MPVIVGGTNYYIQALLWDTLIAKGSSEKVINLLVVFCWRFGAQKKSGSWRWGGGVLCDSGSAVQQLQFFWFASRVQ